jgi:hypothetical protein
MATTAQEDIDAALIEEVKHEQRSLPGVIMKMKTIAVEQYDGKIYDNVYSIFNQLSASERRMFLKGVMNILLIIDDKVNSGVLVNQAYIPSAGLNNIKNSVLQAEQHITDNLSSIEQFNAREMIKLKSTITKIAVITVAVAIVGILLTAVYLSNSRGETIGLFTEFGKIIAEVMGI